MAPPGGLHCSRAAPARAGWSTMMVEAPPRPRALFCAKKRAGALAVGCKSARSLDRLMPE
eukprot:scaffold28610_cov60-Phaeocystis_antarctica.AAC.3